MNGIKLQNIGMLNFLWLVPILWAIFFFGWKKRTKALRSFIDAGLHKKMNLSANNHRRWLKASLFLAAVLFIVFSLTRPAWNEKPETIEKRGRDVVFLLDVSRSMLAEDLVPNRLERAKLAIADCVDRLQGDRVALVAFSGTAAVKCPLTLDYGFFKMMLEDISTESVTRGGTMIGDALRTVMTDIFDEQAKQYKDVILITDGEDHDSFPVEAAKKAGDKGIRLIAIGLGDEREGKRIPVTNEKGEKTFLKYQGREIWSKLDADTLRKMVNATPGGRYFNVATGAIDLGDVYIQLIASADKKSLESQTIKRYEEKYQIFLAAGLILLFLEMAIPERKRSNSVA
jgi:Ca-activated chloride channel homolog